MGSSEPHELEGHRLRTLMTRSTVEYSTAGLGHTIWTGRLLVGELSFRGVSRMRINPPRMGCQVEFQPRVFETRVSCSGGRPTTCDRTPSVALSAVNKQRRPDKKHIKGVNSSRRSCSDIVPLGTHPAVSAGPRRDFYLLPTGRLPCGLRVLLGAKRSLQFKLRERAGANLVL